jgi:prephenate dehydratase
MHMNLLVTLTDRPGALAEVLVHLDALGLETTEIKVGSGGSSARTVLLKLDEAEAPVHLIQRSLKDIDVVLYCVALGTDEQKESRGSISI